MPDVTAEVVRYAVQIDKGEDLIVDDNHLTLTLTPGWAVFNDPTGVALAIPADRIRSIQRLDQGGPREDSRLIQ